MRQSANKAVGDYLQEIGFININQYVYSNDICEVHVSQDGYEVHFDYGGVMYSPSWYIYWLIGVLTYHKLIV